MSRHRIIFIGYWSISDNLTKATILPWLKVMQESEQVDKVVLCTVERENVVPVPEAFLKNLSKIRHQPLYSDKKSLALFTKISDFMRFPRVIAKLAVEVHTTVIFGHGAPSGAIAYKVWKKTGLPFYVSLYEPHAAYMAESGVWKRHGLKYNFQWYWESQQEKYASGLFPVSEKYRLKLLKRGVRSERVVTVPCIVEPDVFKYDARARAALRAKLGWEGNLIGIYVGKFGGLYLKEDAIRIYAQCSKLIPDFRLIILTPDPINEIYTCLSSQSINPEHVLVKNVPREEVPNYLSASDFAFATYKPGPAKIAISPVKVGEYWASGLPVLLTEGVGDESDIIKQEGGGAVFNPKQNSSIQEAILQVIGILQNPQHRLQIPQLILKYRPASKMKEAFEHFFGTGSNAENRI